MIEHAATNTDLDEKAPTEAVPGKLDEINRDMAKRGTSTEHELTTWEAFKIYRKGAFWSMFISLSIIMRAYDIEIMGNFYALPAFQQHFGTYYPGHGYQVPASWVSAIFSRIVAGWIFPFRAKEPDGRRKRNFAKIRTFERREHK